MECLNFYRKFLSWIIQDKTGFKMYLLVAELANLPYGITVNTESDYLGSSALEKLLTCLSC